MGEAIPVEDDGAVRHLVLGRPDEFNTITLAFRNELDAALDAADRDDDVRVVLLRADGKAFCAGFGLDWSTVSQASNDGARGRVWDSVADVRMIGLFGNTFAKLHSTSSGPWPMRPRWRGGSRVAAGAAQAGIGHLAVVDQPGGQSCVRGVPLGRVEVESDGGVGTERVEHPVGVVAVGDDQRAVHHGAEQLEQVGAELVGSDRSGRVEREPPGEHPQAVEEQPLVVVEQLVAPLDRAPQGPLTDLGCPADFPEQGEAVAETHENAGDGEHVRAGGGQLDSKRQPVEGPADARHVVNDRLVEHEVGPHGAAALTEQPDGLGVAHLRV